MDIIVRETHILDDEGNRVTVRQSNTGALTLQTYRGVTVRLDPDTLAALRRTIGSAVSGTPTLA